MESTHPSCFAKVSSGLLVALVLGGFTALGAVQETWTTDRTDPVELTDDLEVTVEEGVTVTCSGVISGDHKLTKKGLGTLHLTAVNTYTGGTVLDEGVLQIGNNEAAGTGPLTVVGSTTQLNQLKFDRLNGSDEKVFTNDITFVSSSSREFPSLYISLYTYLSGTITANGDLYLATGGADDISRADNAAIKLRGPVRVADGYRIAGAPHCLVSFEGSEGLSTPILEGYYAPGPTANGGNAGCFRLSATANDRIGRIIIDQTRIICQNSYCCSNAVIEWTGEHKVAGLGSLVLNTNQRVAAIVTPEYSTTDEGAEIIGNGSTRTFDIAGKAGGSAICYAKFCGLLKLQVSKNDNGGKAIELRNRRHTMTGQYYSSGGNITIGPGSSFSLATSMSLSNGGSLTVTSEEEDIFDSVASLSCASVPIKLMSAAAVRSLSKERRLAATLSGKGNGYNLYLPDEDMHLAVKSYKAYPKDGSSSSTVTVPAGEYDFGSNLYYGLYGKDEDISKGTICCWATRTSWTDVVWTGAGCDSSVTTPGNWQCDGFMPTFNVPLAWAKFGAASVTTASLDREVNWGGLTFTADSTGFTLAKSADAAVLHVYDNGFAIEKNAGDMTERTFAIEPWLDVQVDGFAWAVPAGDTLRLGAVPADKPFVVGEANEGTIELTGTVPAALEAKGGTLALPADATITSLSLWTGALLVMKDGTTELTVENLTLDGVEKVDGDYTFGELSIHVRSGKVPAEPTSESVWTGGADDTGLASDANWEGGVAPKFDAGAKLTFAKSGEQATVAGEVMVHSIIITNAAETAAEGPKSFMLEGATEDPEENVITVYDKVLADQKTPLVLKNVTLANPLRGEGGTPVKYGAKTFTLSSWDTSRAALVMTNAVIEKPMFVTGAGPRWMITAGAGVNEIRGPYTYDTSNWQTLQVNKDATLILSGGVSMNWKSYVYGTGTFVITNKPWVAKQTGNGQIQCHAGRIVFAAPGNYFGTGGGQSGFCVYQEGPATTEFLCDLAFDGRSEIRFRNAGNVRPNTIDFHDTVQKFSAFYWDQNNTETPGQSTITGEAGSCLWVSNLVDTVTSSNFFLIQGEVSVRKSGVGEMLLMRTASMASKSMTVDHTTTGALIVDGGTLTLGEGVTWKNGSSLVVGGTGMLKVTQNGTFGRQADLSISGEGKLFIPEGAKLSVGTATLNGKALEPAAYTADSPLFRDVILGGGRLVVGRQGSVLFVR